MENKKYSINEVFSLLDEEGLKAPRISSGFKKGCEITVEGFPVYSRSLRYSVFYQKGCDCEDIPSILVEFEKVIKEEQKTENFIILKNHVHLKMKLRKEKILTKCGISY